MTPAARISAAIDILDGILAGAAAEQTLTNWARGHRFAGSKDRAAIRDLVFDALRQRRSFAWLGGAETGRGLMIGACRASEAELEAVFSGQGYAPSVLSDEERAGVATLETATLPVQFDCPDWLWPMMEQSLGDDTPSVLAAMQSRARIFLRVNVAKCTRSEAAIILMEEDIATEPHPLSETALEVIWNPRRVRQSRAFSEGLVELQDAASQALVDALLPFARGKRVLDYCAGGGGKSLALVAGGAGEVIAHDEDARRMKDLPARAARACAQIETTTQPQGDYDLVLCDAPCSGSGAWARQPEAKWRLTPERLDTLIHVQREILSKAVALVGKGGALAYATCSLLRDENEDQAEAFLNVHSEWSKAMTRRFLPTEGGDGFFLTVFQKLN